ncbi:MAG: isopeptide-forming domain-containing fimbrial protein [Candidatus Limivicinus sp.]
MKTIKRISCLLLALALILALSVTAFAQNIDSGKGGTASITVKNASKGETYKVVKLFDASVTGKEDGSIVYTGTIPEGLEDYFVVVDGYIQVKDAAKTADGSLSENAVAALKTWAEGQTPDASAVSDGSALVFTNLPFGYYVITTTQGTAITVDSTNPDAIVYDKNSKEPGITKSVNDPDVYIGQTVTYTTTATTANYLGEGKDAEIVTQYVIEDTLPAFLTDVTVTSITIGGVAYTVDGAVPQFGTVAGHTNKAIVIPWAEKIDGKYVSLYNNGAQIVITYTAKVTAEAVVDSNGNTNEVILTPYTTPDDDTTPDPWEDTWRDDETIWTYAAALKKVDENGAPLAGAKFAANGLTVTGSKGNYTVTAFDPASTTLGTEMETDDNGHLVIKGLPSDVTLTVTETEAPDGYNKLQDSISLTPTVINETVTVSSKTTYYDADGNVVDEETSSSTTVITYNEKLKEAAVEVENNKGLELPSTGGIGTTIFYLLGSVLLVGAAILLITKKRMSAEK